MLQIQAYRATNELKYADRASVQMVAYLDSLQQDNGLFYHAPDAPFFWARGNGWGGECHGRSTFFAARGSSHEGWNPGTFSENDASTADLPEQ